MYVYIPERLLSVEHEAEQYGVALYEFNKNNQQRIKRRKEYSGVLTKGIKRRN